MRIFWNYLCCSESCFGFGFKKLSGSCYVFGRQKSEELQNMRESRVYISEAAQCLTTELDCQQLYGIVPECLDMECSYCNKHYLEVKIIENIQVLNHIRKYFRIPKLNLGNVNLMDISAQGRIIPNFLLVGGLSNYHQSKTHTPIL